MRFFLSIGILRSVDVQVVTEISGQTVGPIFNGQVAGFFLDCLNHEDGTDRLSCNVGILLSIYAIENPRRAQSHLDSGGCLEPHNTKWLVPALSFSRSLSSVFCLVTRLLGGQSGVRILAGVDNFSVPENVQTSSGVHSASNSSGTVVISRW